VCEPFLPYTAIKLKGILGISKVISWDVVEKGSELISAGHEIGKGALLFVKIDDKEIQYQLDKLEATKQANIDENTLPEPQKETVDFNDFAKLDIRVGTIVEAVKIPKTKKLLKLSVDIGLDTRTIVSGIAESFTPEEIIGQKVTVLINLEPRKLRGVESEGMILMCDTPDGKLTFIEPDNDSVGNGEQIS
jgi:methionyl-tRNA synthetase